MPLDNDDKTPVDGKSPIEQILELCQQGLAESREARIYCERACDTARQASADFPQLRRDFADHMCDVDSKIEGIKMFQVWLPTIVVSVVAIIKLVLHSF